MRDEEVKRNQRCCGSESQRGKEWRRERQRGKDKESGDEKAWEKEMRQRGREHE